jgi:hypothetical protein
MDGADDDESRVDLAYTLALTRPASTLERERALALVQDLRPGLDAPSDPARERLAWATLTQGLLATAEFRYLD